MLRAPKQEGAGSVGNLADPYAGHKNSSCFSKFGRVAQDCKVSKSRGLGSEEICQGKYLALSCGQEPIDKTIRSSLIGDKLLEVSGPGPAQFVILVEIG